MIRLLDWDKRLAEFIDTARNTPFKWGEFDCVLLAGYAIEAMTGGRIVERYRGQYHDVKTAVRFLRQMGHRNLQEAVINETGGKTCPIPMTMRGDIVVYPETWDHPIGMCGVCIGSHSAFCSEAGLVFRESNLFPERTVGVRF